MSDVYDDPIDRQKSCPPSPVGVFGPGIDLDAVNRRLEETRGLPLRLILPVEPFDKVPDFDPSAYYGPRTLIRPAELENRTVILSPSARIEEAYKGAQLKHNAVVESGGFAVRNLKQRTRGDFGKQVKDGLRVDQLDMLEYAAELEYEFWKEQLRVWRLFLASRGAAAVPVHSLERIVLLRQFIAYMSSMLEDSQTEDAGDSVMDPTADIRTILDTLPECSALLADMKKKEDVQGDDEPHERLVTRDDLVARYKLPISPGRGRYLDYDFEDEDEAKSRSKRVHFDAKPESNTQTSATLDKDSSQISDMLFGMGEDGSRDDKPAICTPTSMPSAETISWESSRCPTPNLNPSNTQFGSASHGRQTPKRKQRSPSPSDERLQARSVKARVCKEEQQASTDQQERDQAMLLSRRSSSDNLTVDCLSICVDDGGIDMATDRPIIGTTTSQSPRPGSFC